MINQGRILILGASGRLGTMLRHYWKPELQPYWQFRRDLNIPDSLVFDPSTDQPELDGVDVIVGLSGVIKGSSDALQVNSDLAVAAVRLGASLGAKRVFLSSSAAVYGQGGANLSENGPVRPSSPYGLAKIAMEEQAILEAKTLGVPATVLRIGNVAGADTLLGLRRSRSVRLDQFADGQGPRRSYIGPRSFADVMTKLIVEAASGRFLPSLLNIALPGTIAMADLLRNAAIDFEWCPAPNAAVPLVHLDVTRLTELMPLPAANAMEIVDDWRCYLESGV